MTWEIAGAIGWILLAILWICYRREHQRAKTNAALYQNLRGHFIKSLETPTPRRSRRALKARRNH